MINWPLNNCASTSLSSPNCRTQRITTACIFPRLRPLPRQRQNEGPETDLLGCSGCVIPLALFKAQMSNMPLRTQCPNIFVLCCHVLWFTNCMGCWTQVRSPNIPGKKRTQGRTRKISFPWSCLRHALRKELGRCRVDGASVSLVHLQVWNASCVCFGAMTLRCDSPWTSHNSVPVCFICSVSTA